MRFQLHQMHEDTYECPYFPDCYICKSPWVDITFKYYLQLIKMGSWRNIRIKWWR